jgi:haloalkane dehalogenase
VASSGWKTLVARVPGAKGQPHTILAGGGHFLQEDIPEAYDRVLLDWLGKSFS